MKKFLPALVILTLLLSAFPRHANAQPYVPVLRDTHATVLQVYDGNAMRVLLFGTQAEALVVMIGVWIQENPCSWK